MFEPSLVTAVNEAVKAILIDTVAPCTMVTKRRKEKWPGRVCEAIRSTSVFKCKSASSRDK